MRYNLPANVQGVTFVLNYRDWPAGLDFDALAADVLENVKGAKTVEDVMGAQHAVAVTIDVTVQPDLREAEHQIDDALILAGFVLEN